jgi:hypothetical protein
MKNIVVFITHKTLTYEHVLCSIYGMVKQDVYSDKVFDALYIYNTNEKEVSTDNIRESITSSNLNKFFNEIKVLNPSNETKSLGEDISLIKEYVKSNYNPEDRVLLLKSDTILSKNYFDEILKIPEDKKDIYFVAPFICAKRRVRNDEIFEYTDRDSVVLSDDITFFVEDSDQSENNDFNFRKHVNITDEEIKFTSCYVIRDFSCHFLNVGLFDKIKIEHKSWGGVNFEGLKEYFISTDLCFVVHKYHNVISENRNSEREGPVEDWLLS